MSEPPSENPPRVNRQTYLALFVVISMSVIIYFDLTEFEKQGGRKSLNGFLAFGYKQFGKWGAIAVWAVFSAILVWLTLYMGGRKKDSR